MGPFPSRIRFCGEDLFIGPLTPCSCQSRAVSPCRLALCHTTCVVAYHLPSWSTWRSCAQRKLRPAGSRSDLVWSDIRAGRFEKSKSKEEDGRLPGTMGDDFLKSGDLSSEDAKNPWRGWSRLSGEEKVGRYLEFGARGDDVVSISSCSAYCFPSSSLFLSALLCFHLPSSCFSLNPFCIVAILDLERHAVHTSRFEHACYRLLVTLDAATISCFVCIKPVHVSRSSLFCPIALRSIIYLAIDALPFVPVLLPSIHHHTPVGSISPCSDGLRKERQRTASSHLTSETCQNPGNLGKR